ncbi:MAG: ATP-binding protein, partial [Stellaceae bacterium]
MNPAITANTIRDRPYFRALAQGQPLAIGEPHKGAVSGEMVIEIAARLSSRSGAFRGVAALVVSQARLAQGWSSVTEPGDTVSLVDHNGTIFARYPAAPLRPGEQPPHFTETSMGKIDAADNGIFDSPPSAIDGVVRRAGFRKLDGFPLYVVYAIAQWNIRRQWYPTVAAFGGLSSVAAAALMLASLAVIRRARREERERRFSELLIENSIDGIVAKDSDLRYTVWSRGMERMSGIPAKKVIGRGTEDVFEQSAVGPTAAAFWRDALAGRTTVETDRPYDVPHTGRHGYYDQTLTPFKDGEGKIIGAVAFVHDATARHFVEAELRQAQKMEAVGQLTGGIAHDFNNLLTVIFGNLETLQRHMASDPQSRQFVDAAERAAQRAATLTDQLLAFGRRQPLNRRLLDLDKLVARMSDLLRRTLGERIAIECILAGGVWRVSADANQLENAVLNLALNARDAMPDGGTLTIRTSAAAIDKAEAVSGYELLPGEYGLVEVADTGTGMSEAVIARAFEPFFTTKEVGKGSGLGLSQVYGFMKQLGGHATIRSELGRGTLVTLYLPRIAADETDAGTLTGSRGPERAAPPRRGNETILLVEDD